MRTLQIHFDPDSDTPLYLQLAEELRSAIASGKAVPGERLPSIRRLADQCGVNPATVVSAYRLLETELWAEARAGSGMYVRGIPGSGAAAVSAPSGPGAGAGSYSSADKESEDAALLDLAAGKVLLPPGVLDLAAGAPSPALFPLGSFKSLMNEVLDRDGGWAFGYQESAGWPPLREAVAAYYRSDREVQVDTEDLSIVSGAQQGLDLAAKALLSGRDAVAVESPTYRGALSAFWSRGARTLPIPLEKDGMDLNVLEDAAKKESLRLVYVIPRYQNPTTRCWSEAKLRDLLALAERYGFFVLEDDLLSDLHFGAAPKPTCLKALDGGDRVVYVHGFSKVLMPGLRLGALVGPRRFRSRFEAAKRATDISTDGLSQRTLELYLRRGAQREQTERLRGHYRNVYSAALEAAAELADLGVDWEEPGGGLHLWLRLPEGASGTALRARCLARGCSVVPEAVYALGAGNGPAADSHVRVSFAAVDEGEIRRGLGLVAQALRDLGSPGRGPTELPLV